MSTVFLNLNFNTKVYISITKINTLTYKDFTLRLTFSRISISKLECDK